MVHTLRGRFVLSHVLPLLVIVPLMGIALIYVLETRVLLPNLSRALAAQALLVAEVARDQPDIWVDPIQAQVFVTRVGRRVDGRLMLIDQAGRLLASADSTDADRVGQRLDLPGLARALAGEPSARTTRSERLDSEVADVLVPVADLGQPVAGVVRLSLRLTNVTDQFLRLRYFIGGVLMLGILMGAAVGWTLALNLERPLRTVTQAVGQFAGGGQWVPPVEQRTEEIGLLVHALDSMVQHLRDLEEARRHLLANLVHELGRPLGALRSAVQALQGGADESAALRRELLAGIEEELRRLQRLLDDLAHLYEQVLGALELDRRPIAPGEWLSHVLAPWREAAQKKGLRWQATVPSDLPPIQADPDRLAQALGNLLSNAVKYTSAGGTVSVEAGVEGETLWIQVSDTGPGIAPEEQTRIFEAFYRGQSARRFPQGMGLGLTIAHDLVTAHGGRLEVDSAPGLGSHFTLWIPLGARRS